MMHRNNFENPDLNPCFEEAQQSLDCMKREFYSKSNCADYFENYKECKKFWEIIIRQRRKKGITPRIPSLAERKKILKLKDEGINVDSVND